VLAQTLRVVLAHFAAIGVAPDAQRRALQEALRRTDEPLQRHEASALHAARARVELLAAWHRQPRYLDDRGQPLSLSLQGTPSLSELFARFLPTTDAKGLASELLAEGVIDRDAPGRWRPARRTLLVATNSDGALERLPFQIHALLSTLAHNGAAPRADQRRLERTVYVDRFPVSLLREFDQYTRRMGSQVIEDCDNWLLQRERSLDDPEPTVSVGVGLYAFVESPPARPTSKPRAKRARRSP